jgi:hypothetical protein
VDLLTLSQIANPILQTVFIAVIDRKIEDDGIDDISS